jgi:hypothetical protein
MTSLRALGVNSHRDWDGYSECVDPNMYFAEQVIFAELSWDPSSDRLVLTCGGRVWNQCRR